MNYLSKFSRAQNEPKVLRSGASSLTGSDRMARGLGWLSIGLGLTALLAARQVARSLGMEGREAVLRAYGAREVLSGVLCLSVDKQFGLWSRVAGDGLDIATLSTALTDKNPKRANVALAFAMVAGIALLDVVAAQSAGAQHNRPSGKARSYSDRSGFPHGLPAARSKAQETQVHADGGETADSALSGAL